MDNNDNKKIGRDFLKDTVRLKFDFSTTDQHRGFPPPPIEKSFNPEVEIINLVPIDQLNQAFPGDHPVSCSISSLERS